MASLDVNVTMNIMRGFSARSKSINAVASGLNEVNELNELGDLKQSLFEIQNTTARQLNELEKLRQSLSVAGANSGSGSVRMARSG